MKASLLGMRASLLASAITAATLALGSPGAVAQPNGGPHRQYDEDRRGQPRQRVEKPQRPEARDPRSQVARDRYDVRDRRWADDRGRDGRDGREWRERQRVHEGGRRNEYRGEPQHGQSYRYDRYQHDYHARPHYRAAPAPHWRHDGRGAGPRYDIHRGARLPHYYRTPHYVVHDWHAHWLPAPPYGHYWVQVGADYLLVAIATGLVVQLMLAY